VATVAVLLSARTMRAVEASPPLAALLHDGHRDLRIHRGRLKECRWVEPETLPQILDGLNALRSSGTDERSARSISRDICCLPSWSEAA
jgi:hypothetical protein